MRENITAIVLAGGESSRMGRDKALLPKGNQTLLSYVCTVAQESANCVYIVTPWTKKYQHIIPNSCRLITEHLINPHSKSNFPLMGFFQGLQLVKTPWILLLACDLPYINSESIKSWYYHLTQVTENTIAVLPRSAKGWEPLCGFYHHSCQTSLQNYLHRGGKSFQQWLEQSVVMELPVCDLAKTEVVRDRSILFNCNTPEDWNKTFYP